MASTDSITDSTDDLSRLRRWRRDFPTWRRHANEFGLYLGRRFQEDEAPLWAGMLCYTTLLSLVPLMAVTLGVVSAFPVFQEWSQDLRSFIFRNFVPATGDVLERHLDQFVDKASEASAIGVLALVLSSILLMVNMERALNRIFRARAPRSMGSRFVVYWSVLTVGPLLLGASLAISSYVASLPAVEVATNWLGVRGLLLTLAPIAASALAFTLIFIIVPNVAVPWRYAGAGGLVTALFFEMAKSGLALYVTQFPAYRTIYGAFAAIPILLLWVYLTWLVALFGASFAATLINYRFADHRRPWPRGRELLLLFRLLRHLWRAQKQGDGLTLRQLLEEEPRAGLDQTRRLLDLLESERLVKATQDGSWILARDLDDVMLYDLYDALSTVSLAPAGHGDEAACASSERPRDEAGDDVEDAGQDADAQQEPADGDTSGDPATQNAVETVGETTGEDAAFEAALRELEDALEDHLCHPLPKLF